MKLGASKSDRIRNGVIRSINNYPWKPIYPSLYQSCHRKISLPIRNKINLEINGIR